MPRNAGLRSNLGPVLSSAPTSPALGDTYTNSGNNHSYVYAGASIGWYDLTAATQGPPLTALYTITNDLTDRSYDANATTVDELADVMASLIRDLGAGNRATYTVTNGAADRTYDANSTTVNELADVLATIISDLQASGWLN